MFPLQLPGGPEILVILLVFLVPLALLAGVVGLVVYLVRQVGGEDDERVEELEARVEELEAELRTERRDRE